MDAVPLGEKSSKDQTFRNSNVWRLDLRKEGGEVGERERQRQGKRANWKDEITKQKQPRTHSLGPLKKEDTSLLFPYTRGGIGPDSERSVPSLG